MTVVVEGVYRQGKIELLQEPPGVPEGRVRVILIADDPSRPPAGMLTYGKYPGDASALEDFTDAQWHGDRDWDDGHGR
jgi:hypothetical protein